MEIHFYTFQVVGYSNMSQTNGYRLKAVLMVVALEEVAHKDVVALV